MIFPRPLSESFQFPCPTIPLPGCGRPPCRGRRRLFPRRRWETQAMEIGWSRKEPDYDQGGVDDQIDREVEPESPACLGHLPSPPPSLMINSAHQLNQSSTAQCFL